MYVNSSMELSNGSAMLVIDLSSPAPASARAAAFALGDDDDDVQILAPGGGWEVAAELAAAARRAIAEPESSASRKRKRPAVETKAEPTECTICCDDCTLVGAHRLVALRCGHLFGKKCIERWIGRKRTCPNCNSRVRRTDVCPLFSDHVAVVDNAGLDDMTKKFEAEQLKSKKQEKELAAVKKQLEMKMSEAVRLNADVFKLKKCLAESRRGGAQKQVAQPAVAAANGNHQVAASAALVAISHKTRQRPATNISSGNAVAQVTQAQASSHVANPSAQVQRPRGAVLSAAPLAGRDMDELTAAIGKYKPVFDVPLLGARVFGIAPSCRFVCVGEKLAENSYGLVMLNANDGRGRTRVAVHNSEVRDLCFWELESHVLTVAFDGKLAVTNLREQKVMVQVELPPDRQGWSCCLSETDPNAMFCGFQDGSVAQYDMRKPGPVASRASSRTSHSPSRSLCIRSRFLRAVIPLRVWQQRRPAGCQFGKVSAKSRTMAIIRWLAVARQEQCPSATQEPARPATRSLRTSSFLSNGGFNALFADNAQPVQSTDARKRAAPADDGVCRPPDSFGPVSLGAMVRARRHFDTGFVIA